MSTTAADVERIATSLPGVERSADGLVYRVGGRNFVWTYLERTHPRARRVPRADAIGVRVAHDADKRDLLASDPAAFFTTDHYDGYDAVLVWLPQVSLATLEVLIEEAWRCRAAASLLRQRPATPARSEG